MPVPEAYPEITAGVPEPGIHPAPAVVEEPLPQCEPAPTVPVTEAPRPHPAPPAECAPEDVPPEADTADTAEPEDASPPPPAEDLLTPQARVDFSVTYTSDVPSIRVLRGRYGIGQPRAQRIKKELENALS